jgi:hypothetical protein
MLEFHIWFFWKPKFIYQIFFIENLATEIGFSIGLDCVIFRSNFFGIGLIVNSIVFYFLSWRYLRLCTFEDYTWE